MVISYVNLKVLNNSTWILTELISRLSSIVDGSEFTAVIVSKNAIELLFSHIQSNVRDSSTAFELNFLIKS